MSQSGSVSLLASRILTTFYRRLVVITKDTDPYAAVAAPAIPAEIRILDKADLREYFAFKPFQPRHEVESRLEQGHSCFVAWYEGRIVHAGWAATGRAHIPYIHSDILLPPTAFFIYDSYTVPAFRRARLVLARSSAMHVHFGAKGFVRSYGIVTLMNRPGLAILGPAGYRRIGMYGCVRLGPLHHTWAYANPSEPLPRLAKPETA